MNLKKPLVILALSLATFIGVGISFSAYEKYIRTLPPLTNLSGLLLEGLNRPEALSLIEGALDSYNQRVYEIELSTGEVKRFTSQELGIRYEPQKTLARIFSSTSWFARAHSTSEPTSHHTPVVSYDQETFETTLKNGLQTAEMDFKNAEILWNDEKKWTIKPEMAGLVLKEGEFERVAQEIRIMAEKVLPSVSLPVSYEPVEPMRKSEDLEPNLKTLQEKISKPITLVLQQEKKEFSFADQHEWISIDPLDQSIQFNEVFAKEWIEQYALEQDRMAGVMTISGIQQVTSEYDKKTFKKAVYSGDLNHGRKIDQAKLLEALRNVFHDHQLDRKILIESEDILPSIRSQVSGYEFPQILSTGISSFRYGNHPNRVKNIKLSIGSFQGIVVDPGEEFSFNRVTGWITPNKGYTKTQVIMEGRVEEGVGGGVCQSSTTMYRAILNAGFQVTERRNHTLDIIYYHEYGYGLDATVYTDSRSDLKFVNNFSAPILINTYTDDFKKEVFVEMYGTTDQRRVELTQIDTGDYLLKKWNWKVIWPDRFEDKEIVSRYQLPKEEEEKPKTNPLEG